MGGGGLVAADRGWVVGEMATEGAIRRGACWRLQAAPPETVGSPGLRLPPAARPGAVGSTSRLPRGARSASTLLSPPAAPRAISIGVLITRRPLEPFGDRPLPSSSSIADGNRHVFGIGARH